MKQSDMVTILSRVLGFLLLGLFVIFMLVGCACEPKKEYVEVPVEVKVPIAIKCKVTYPNPPTIDIGKLPIPAELDDKGILLIQENEQNRQYAKQLKVLLDTCADRVPAP